MDLPEIPGLSAEEGAGGLTKLVVDLPSCRGELYLHGAQVTEWTPAGHEPVLWLSPQAVFAEAHAIRGGVPICFPWFGSGPDGDLSPAHGLARTGPWVFAGAQRHGDTVRITLQLTRDGVADRAGANHWTSDFRATYTVEFGSSLTMTLDVDPADPPTQSALHTYLRVGDVRQVAVTGLDHHHFFDQLTGETRTHHGTVTFTGETDRIYHHTNEVRLSDPVLGRQVRIAKSGSPHTVVWNPWIDKARQLADVPDDAWLEFVCLESANLSQTLRMCTSISVDSLK